MSLGTALRAFILSFSKPASLRIVDLIAASTSWPAKRRLGRNADGGYVIPHGLITNTADYALLSFGVADDVSFEVAFSDAYPNIPVYCFDPTVSGLPTEDPRIKFTAIGLAGTDQPSRKLFSLASIIERLGLEPGRKLILKIDIEGWEWDLFDKTPFDGITAPLIMLECHFAWKPGSYAQFILYARLQHKKYLLLKKLLANYTVVHCHANNYAYIYYDNLAFPSLLELTLVGKSLVPVAVESDGGRLDYPNCPDRVDHQFPFSI